MQPVSSSLEELDLVHLELVAQDWELMKKIKTMNLLWKPLFFLPGPQSGKMVKHVTSVHYFYHNLVLK